MRYVRLAIRSFAVAAVFAGLFTSARPASAAATGEFHIQVSPSPLVTLVKPGTSTTIDLNVRNNAGETEELKIVPRAFTLDDKSEQLELADDELPDLASWITFGSSTFTVQPGKTFTQHIKLTVPKETGFSYAFAFVISRVNQPVQTTGRTIKASVAVFTLINVDRPGAVRALQVTRFVSKKGLYEYLPAMFEIDFKNTGNTIVQPSGNLFIQRDSTDPAPLATLSINKAGGYILPGATRTITVKWENGFQVLTPKPQPDGTTKDELTWNWNQLADIRLGKYTAKLVAIYDDGFRDVPLQGELTFWVVPWLMLLIVLAVLLLLFAGIWSMARSLFKASRKIGKKKIRL
jgi:hypothetical protein